MINKYISSLKIRRVPNEPVHYATILPTQIPVDSFQLVIRTVAGDRFDTLAHHYYKDSSKWWIIAKANALAKGMVFIPAGTKLIIPSAGL